MNDRATVSTSLSERAATAFSRLAKSADNINSVSTRINKQISLLETCLKRINLGVACWTTIVEARSDHQFWSHSVGYARLNGNWCIALETRDGADWLDEDNVERWPFSEAPRFLQPKAIDKLPDLIEALIAATDGATDRLEEKVAPVEEIVSAVRAAASSLKR